MSATGTPPSLDPATDTHAGPAADVESIFELKSGSLGLRPSSRHGLYRTLEGAKQAAADRFAEYHALYATLDAEELATSEPLSGPTLDWRIEQRYLDRNNTVALGKPVPTAAIGDRTSFYIETVPLHP